MLQRNCILNLFCFFAKNRFFLNVNDFSTEWWNKSQDNHPHIILLLAIHVSLNNDFTAKTLSSQIYSSLSIYSFRTCRLFLIVLRFLVKFVTFKKNCLFSNNCSPLMVHFVYNIYITFTLNPASWFWIIVILVSLQRLKSQKAA